MSLRVSPELLLYSAAFTFYGMTYEGRRCGLFPSQPIAVVLLRGIPFDLPALRTATREKFGIAL